MIRRIARGRLDNNILENEFDEIVRQLNAMINDSKATKTITFYSASTSGGSATTKNTVKINQYGKIISWEQA